MSIHVDGVMKPLLKYLQDGDYDAVEAPTPEPQGDVSLEAIKEAVGDKIIMDRYTGGLLPAGSLSRDHADGTCVTTMVEMFHPRLVLGVSDEVPPDRRHRTPASYWRTG